MEIEARWDNTDIFVLVAPTATGKSAVARTLMNWQRSTAVCTPSNLLVEQFVAEFPGTDKLQRMDSYWCEPWGQSCAQTRGRTRGFCKGCICSKELATARYRQGPVACTYHTYLYQRLWRRVLVMDEAHNLARIVGDLDSIRLWQHDLRYPSAARKPEEILQWLEGLPPHKQKGKRIQQLHRVLTDPVPKYVIQRTEEWFAGKGTARGQPELRDCIKFHLLDPSRGVERFLPDELEKLILMSGTISQTDIRELGLQKHRVTYIHCASPIPVDRRPIYPLGLVTVNRGNIEESTKEIAQYLESDVLPAYPEQKGVIHATYQMSRILQESMLSDRLLFHTRDNRRAVYEAFRAASAESGRVLVACGMYEGIDLPDDLGRWQVVTRMPWKSLGDPAIRWKADHDSEWYAWQALKDLIQACGRISRHEGDYGETLILDRSFDTAYTEYRHLIPPWFQEAVHYN